MAPLVTVIVSTYNWSTVLPFCIARVLDQTFRDFELLVIGDCCTDDTAEIVAAISDPRLRWINLSSHIGHQAGPNNRGLAEARGQFIAYLGHDDLWLPHHLACAVEALQSSNAAMAPRLTPGCSQTRHSERRAIRELAHSYHAPPPSIYAPPPSASLTQVFKYIINRMPGGDR
jgi:GT2 family glycosyltransferase